MGIGQKNLITSRSEYTLSYTGMEGVDFTTGGIIKSRHRYAYLENMYKDYDGDGDGITESIPGFRRLTHFPDKINAIYSHKGDDLREYIVVHAGKKLYRFPLEERDETGSLSAIGEICDTRSNGFVCGNDLFILDGEKLTRVAGDGSFMKVEDSSLSPYIPTVYVNGEEYEQRNLLTNYFYEKYTVNSMDEYIYGTPTLKYTILSQTEMSCAVSGIEGYQETEIWIPSYAEINGQKYTVTEISDGAFERNNDIITVRLSPKTSRIGKRAFAECGYLCSVICSEGTEIIGDEAFDFCMRLESIYLGRAISYIGADAFSNCDAFSKIKYSQDSEEFNLIDGVEELEGKSVIFNERINGWKISIPVFSPVYIVHGVYLDEEAVSYYHTYVDGFVKYITLDNQSVGLSSIAGKEIKIYGIFDDRRSAKYSLNGDFISMEGEKISGFDAICGCRICESFDGRIFLSGNERLPNTVFYSSRNSSGRNDPTYFGIFNYFNDGTGSYPVKSILTAGDSLAVFKSGDDGGGSIYYHTPKETESNLLPKIYPANYTHNGISALGESISFFDDPLFISALGITALEKRNINLEKSIAVRSHNINSKLLTENLENASLAKWCGYLVVCTGSRFYLADSRAMFTHSSGNKEYEWYYLNGIGTYDSTRREYVYASVGTHGLHVHPDAGKPVPRNYSIISSTDSEGITYYCTSENRINYEINPTEQYIGGSFYPATCVFGTTDGQLLLFGTELGDLCIFNNDKRGIAPDFIRDKEDFDEVEYKKHFSGRIHPHFYSFAGHAPRYAVKTVKDDCGIPHLTKSTVKHSAVIKIRNFGSGKISFECGTENKGYKEIASLPASDFSFEDMNFSNLSFYNSDYLSIPLAEKEKGWIEKDYNFYTNEFESPFGICSIAYRFFVKGKIKKG